MLALRSMLRAGAARSPAALAAGRKQAVRAFSGNWEYPKIEGSVADITNSLNTIGARLSIPTAALYLTKPKINHIVREMKGAAELKEVQRVLLLCDAKLVYPSDFATGTFFSACIKLDAVDTAMEFLRKAENVRHYMNNNSFVRLAKHFAAQEDQESVKEILQLMNAKGVTLSTKTYHFRVLNAISVGNYDEAVAIAKEAANVRQINSNLIILLLNGLEGDARKEQLPLARYLVDKGEVFVNARLADFLAGGDGKLPEPVVEVAEETEAEATEGESAEDTTEEKPAEDK
ncbi:hypothetical protein BBJ28_00002322 [Nothophytophthora sp. Chile5]|nr:hypothetical protein BBJ28_00002322 [Nothophytophthora sp. Chile5]